MGSKIMMYYSTGSLVVSFLYFTGKSFGWIMNDRSERSLTTNEKGATDYGVMTWILLNALVQVSIILLLNENFYLSILADLNIGIA